MTHQTENTRTSFLIKSVRVSLYKITMKVNIVQQMYPLNHTYINDIIKIKSI